MKPRISKYGFYCGKCKKFVYQGFDRRDNSDLKSAICISCGKYLFDEVK